MTEWAGRALRDQYVNCMGSAAPDLSGIWRSQGQPPLREILRGFILENFLFTDDLSAVGYGDSLLGKGIVDSTGMLEVILFIEERFGVTIRDEEMIPENLDSIDRLVAFIKSRRQVA